MQYTQWAVSPNYCKFVSHILGYSAAGLLEHTLRDVYPHEVLVAEHAQDAPEHAGACAGIQHGPPDWDPAPHEPGGHGGYRVAQTQHVVFVIFGPLVVSARQLADIAGRVDVL